MKTLKQIDIMIQENVDVVKKSREDNKTKKKLPAEKKALAKIAFLNMIKMYLETAPSEDFIKTNLDIVNKAIKTREDSYTDWLKSGTTGVPFGTPESKMKTFYNTYSGLKELKKQKETLDFILNV